MGTNGRVRARQGRSVLATAAMTAAAGALMTASSADAGIMLDLRAVALNGQPLSGGATAKQLTVSGPGDVVTLDLFAIVTGTNGINDEQVQSTFGAVTSSGALLGNLSGGAVAPFTANGSQDGSVQDIDGDTDLDIGVVPNGGTPVTGYFAPRSENPTNLTPLDANSGEVRMGSFTFTVTGGGADVFLNFIRRTNASGGNVFTSGVWFEDGVVKVGTLSPVSSGIPVHVVPEPGSLLVTAGAVASLGLLARRRPTA